MSLFQSPCLLSSVQRMCQTPSPYFSRTFQSSGNFPTMQSPPQPLQCNILPSLTSIIKSSSLYFPLFSLWSIKWILEIVLYLFYLPLIHNYDLLLHLLRSEGIIYSCHRTVKKFWLYKFNIPHRGCVFALIWTVFPFQSLERQASLWQSCNNCILI